MRPSHAMKACAGT